MIEAGTYRARALGGSLCTLGSRGTPCVSVEFEIETGERIEWNGWLTDKAVERTFDALRLCGWTGDDVRLLDGISANEVELVVELEDYNGRTFSRVKWVNAPGRRAGSSAGALAPDTAAAIASGLKGMAIASRQKPGQARQVPSARPAQRPAPAARQPERRDEPPDGQPDDSILDSDIPF